MFFFLNWKGLGFLVVAAVVGLGAIAVLPSFNGPPFHYLVGSLLALLDLGYRYRFLRQRPEVSEFRQESLEGDRESVLQLNLSEYWLTTGRGDSLMFLPAWCFGALYPVALMALA